MGSHTRRKHPQIRGGSTCFSAPTTAFDGSGPGTQEIRKASRRGAFARQPELVLSRRPGAGVAFNVCGRN